MCSRVIDMDVRYINEDVAWIVYICSMSKGMRCVNEGVAWTAYMCSRSKGVRCVNEGVTWTVYVCNRILSIGIEYVNMCSMDYLRVY